MCRVMSSLCSIVITSSLSSQDLDPDQYLECVPDSPDDEGAILGASHKLVSALTKRHVKYLVSVSTQNLVIRKLTLTHVIQNLQTSVHISGVLSTSLWYSALQDEASKLSSLLGSSIMKSLKMIFLQRISSEERSCHRRQL